MSPPHPRPDPPGARGRSRHAHRAPRRHRHRGPAPRRSRRGVSIALGVALVLALLLAGVATLVRGPDGPGTPEPTAPQTVSCARYGLEDVAVAARGPQDREDTGLLDLELFGPGQQLGDRFGLHFAHDGVRSRYHVLAEGLDWDRPVGVIYHFHGDGAFEYEQPQYSVSCMAEVAREHNMLLVVPRTPDVDGEPTWWEELERNGEWVRALVAERVLGDYDIDRTRTWFTGYSGGAQFISRELLADHLELIPGGGAIMMGGGEAPDSSSAEPTRSQLRNLWLHWDVGLEDDGEDPRARFDALSAARAGHAWYEDAGYDRTSLEIRAEVDHFQLPYAAVLEGALEQAERARNVAGAADGDRRAGSPT